MATATLHIGAQAPEFTLPETSGRQVSLHDFRGKWVVLYFYPQDDTPGCTKEACDFRDALADFSDLNAVILGVSKDSQTSHEQFVNKYRLPFTLLSDPGLKVLQTYGVWQAKAGDPQHGSTKRTTFLIDPLGRLSRIYPEVKVAGHVAAVLSELRREVRA